MCCHTICITQMLKFHDAARLVKIKEIKFGAKYEHCFLGPCNKVVLETAGGCRRLLVKPTKSERHKISNIFAQTS